MLVSMRERQARVFVPPIFILISSVYVADCGLIRAGSADSLSAGTTEGQCRVLFVLQSQWQFLKGRRTFILIRASRTMGPQAFKSTEYFCMVGFSVGVSGF